MASVTHSEECSPIIMFTANSMPLINFPSLCCRWPSLRPVVTIASVFCRRSLLIQAIRHKHILEAHLLRKGILFHLYFAPWQAFPCLEGNDWLPDSKRNSWFD